MAQLTVTPTIDSYMNFISPDTNYGSDTQIKQGVFIAGANKQYLNRAIVNFDVSAISSQAVITQAKMQRNLSLVENTNQSVRIARCTRPTEWTQSGVTWNKYDGVNNWVTGGGEYDDVTPAAVSYVEAGQIGLHEIFGLGGFVEDALTNRAGIVSLIFRNEDEAPTETQRSTWLAGSFWKLIIDYNLSGELGRLDPSGEGPGPGARRPVRPRRPVSPSEGRLPALPPEGRAAPRGR